MNKSGNRASLKLVHSPIRSKGNCELGPGPRKKQFGFRSNHQSCTAHKFDHKRPKRLLVDLVFQKIQAVHQSKSIRQGSGEVKGESLNIFRVILTLNVVRI